MTIGDSTVQAQLIPDSTLGTEASIGTPTTLNGNPINVIEAVAQRGGSLFHSFSDFNVMDGQQVYFSNPAGVERFF